MSNRNYSRGRAYEYKAKKELEAEGYQVIRAAGSHGPWDLIAVPRDVSKPVRCVQIKVTKVEKAIALLVRNFTDAQPPSAATMSENGATATFVSELWVWHKAEWHKFIHAQLHYFFPLDRQG